MEHDATMIDASEPARPPRRPISTDTKVALVALSLVALVAVGIGIAVAVVAVVGSGADAVERHARYSAAVDAAALHAKGMANNERGFLIDGSESFVGEMEGRAELVRASFSSALESATDEQRSTLLEAREAFERWLDQVEQELALYRSGDEEGAIEMSLGPSRTARWTYEGWLADANSLGVAGFSDATAAVDRASTFSVILLLGYLALAAAIAAALTLWIVRTVLRPSMDLARTLSESREEAEPTSA
jgi:methyl-accepting chemotaxis protein